MVQQRPAVLLWVVLLLVLLLVLFTQSEELAEEPALFLWLLRRLLVLRCGSILCGIRRRRYRLYDRRRRPLHNWSRGLLFSQPENLLEEIALIAIGVIAGIGRLCSVEKRRGVSVIRTGGIGEQVRAFIQSHERDARRDSEFRNIRVLRQRDGALHEIGPDGSRGLHSLELDVRIVIISDPDDAQQVRRISSEPCIIRSPCFSGGGGSEA